MYNGCNVEPQTHNTGIGGPNNSEPKMSVSPVTAHELPTPTGESRAPVTPVQFPAAVAPPTSSSGSQGNGPEHWANEVEQLFDRTIQSPRQRADELNELRRRYQREVLGIIQKAEDD